MIKGISEKRRLPRAGKIRLGIKQSSKKPCKSCKGKGNINGTECWNCQGTGNMMYPKEVDYFVCPAEVEKKYGKKPRSIDVMLPVDDPKQFFPQCLKMYGKSKGLKCWGDGVKAFRVNEKTREFEEIECPYHDCEFYKKKWCTEVANLMVLLHEVGVENGIYQIDTGSYHSIIQINSDVDFLRGLVASKTGYDWIAMIPLKLVREPKETHGSGRKETHWCLRLKMPNEVFKHLTLENLPIPRKQRLITVGRRDIEEDLYPRTIVDSLEEEGEVIEGELVNEQPAAEETAPPAQLDESSRDLLMNDIKAAYKKLGQKEGTPIRKKLDARYKDHPQLLLDYLKKCIEWKPGQEKPKQPMVPGEKMRTTAPEEESPFREEEPEEKPPAQEEEKPEPEEEEQSLL